MIQESHNHLPTTDWQGELIPFAEYPEDKIQEAAGQLASISAETEALLESRGLGTVAKLLRRDSEAYFVARRQKQLETVGATEGSFVIVNAKREVQGEAVLHHGVLPQRRSWVAALRRTGKHFDHPLEGVTPYIRAWTNYDAILEGTLSHVYHDLVQRAYASDETAHPWTIEPISSIKELHEAVEHPATSLRQMKVGRYIGTNATAGLVLKSRLYVAQTLDEAA